MENVMQEVFGEVIHAYTRANAIEDGYLIDVTVTAKEAGFKCPVAITREAWEQYVSWSEEDNKKQRTLQDEDGRLWDVLWMAYLEIKKVKAPCNELPYTFFCVPKDGRSRASKPSQLVLHVGPGDDLELVITIKVVGQD